MRVVRIPVPLPDMAARTANAWLLPDPPMTLVDCGPDAPGVLDALLAGCRGAGVRLRDVERILITHGHVDHHGLAGKLAEVCDAEILIHADDLLAVRDPAAYRARRLRETEPALRAAGVAEAEIETMRARFDFYQSLAAPAPRAKAYPTTVIEAGGSLCEVLPTPGHSPGSVVLHFPRERSLFTGDVLLPKLTTAAVAIAERERDALAKHLAALERLLAIGPATAHPGHGEAFEDHGQAIARDLAHFSRRSDRVRAALVAGPRTAREVAAAIGLGQLDLHWLLSEILGHLGLLASTGAVAPEKDEDVVRWRLLQTDDDAASGSEP